MKNIAVNPNKNIIKLAKEAGTTYFTVNGTKAGIIGGSEKDQQNNLRCIQFIAENIDGDCSPEMLSQQGLLLTMAMANTEGIDLDNIEEIDGKKYIIDLNNGTVSCFDEIDIVQVLNIEEKYGLKPQELTSSQVAAIVKLDLPEEKQEGMFATSGIEINQEQKLDVIDMIKGLRKLGMSSSWFNVNGEKQPFPICYNGEADLKGFEKVVQDAIDNNQSYLDAIILSANYDENQIVPDDEVIDINGVECIVDYENKAIYDITGTTELAQIKELEVELPAEVIKTILTQKASEKLNELDEDLNW